MINFNKIQKDKSKNDLRKQKSSLNIESDESAAKGLIICDLKTHNGFKLTYLSTLPKPMLS